MSEQNSSPDPERKSPFRGPGFIAAVVVVAIIAALGIGLGITNLVRGNDPAPEPSTSAPSATPSASPSSTPDASGDCDVPGGSDATTLAAPPDAQWEFQGTTAYPTSTEYGPTQTAPEGYRLCYQQSVEGALLAAASTVAFGSDPAVQGPWLEYILAEGPGREAALAAQANQPPPSSSTRLNVAGFRVLSYTGDTALIDIAVSGTAQGDVLYVASAVNLVWEDGDWRVVADESGAALDGSQIANLAGFVPWGPS